MSPFITKHRLNTFRSVFALVISSLLGTQNTGLLANVGSHVSAGGEHSLLIRSDGSLWATGSYESGQTGHGRNPTARSPSITSISRPTGVLNQVQSASAGESHSLFIKTDGSLWATGDNSSGQLGTTVNNGNFDSRPPRDNFRITPIQVASDVAAASAGGSHSLYKKADDSLWAMGNNLHGQLGIPTSSGSNYEVVPAQVTTNVSAVSAGQNHSAFIKTDSSLWAMGENTLGQLGDGTTVNRGAPIQIASNVRLVSAGASHTLYVKQDSSLWAHGLNAYGQLGDGSTTNRTTSVQIATNVRHVSAGSSHTLFIKQDDSLWAMGRNHRGQLGDGSTTDRTLPVQIATDILHASVGGDHSLFVKKDGSFWAMGDNGDGQLGDGSQTTRSTPVLIGPAIRQQQVIQWPGINPQLANTELSLSATASSNLPVSFKLVSGPATLTSKTLRFLSVPGTDDVVVQATQTGNFTFLDAHPVTQNIAILKQDQTITFPPIPDYTISDAFFNLNATSSSGLPVVFSITSGPATLGSNGRTVSSTGETGLVTIIASQPGNGAYKPAPPTQRTFNITQNPLIPQIIYFQNLEDRFFEVGGPNKFSLDAFTLSGLPITYTLTGPATLFGNQVTLTGLPGIITITASQEGDATYAPATPEIRSFTVTVPIPANEQLIVFNQALPNRLAKAGSSIVLTASATPSALTVQYWVSGPASLASDGKTLRLDGTPGTVTIVASQPGGTRNGVTYGSATPVIRSFEATAGPPTEKQTVTFAQPSVQTYGNDPVELIATASSGLPVTFELISTTPASIAKLENEILTILGAGKVTIRAMQSGNATFKPSPPVTRTLVIAKAPLVVLAEDATRAVGVANPSFTLTYQGFLGDDTQSALDRLPLPTTKATVKSPSGSYDITFTGGLDNNYAYVPAEEPGQLTIVGFGGTYEALLVRGDFLPALVPVGKLTVVVSPNALTYTGTLALAAETASASIKGSIVIAEDLSSATLAFNRATTASLPELDLALIIASDRSVEGTLERGGKPFAFLDQGARLYVPAPRSTAPWIGAHTIVLNPPANLLPEGALPAGSGHSTANINASGALKLTGKLADGTTLTATLKPDDAGHYRLYVNPYGKRLESFLSGHLPLLAHPDTDRYTIPRYYIPDSALIGSIYWQKAASPAKPLDKSYRTGFGPLAMLVNLDPWIAPSAAVTIPRLLGLTESNTASATLDLDFLPELLDLGASGPTLPSALNVTRTSGLTVPLPNPRAFKFTSFNAKTGAFAGSFSLSDPSATSPKPVLRSVTFSGVLRQPPSGENNAPLGQGFFLLPALPDAASAEQLSGEIRLLPPP